jgi:glycosyltransferase involved in cell wall biosynthesis
MTRPLAGMRLLITSHVVHYRFEDRLYAYGPYAREIDLWADLFREIVIASPCRDEHPPGDCLAFERANISIAPQKQSGGETALAKLGLLVSVPAMLWGLGRAMSKADAIHVRCPGNLGLLGVLLAPLFRKPIVAKYAAQWNAARDEPRSARLQKWLLRSRWWKGPVTVYGKWPNQPAHVIPFFTSLLSGEQMDRARAAAERKRAGGPLNVLYTGRLSKAKHVDVVLRAVAEVRKAGHAMTCTVVGVGPERPGLESLAAGLNIADGVEFTGGLAFAEVVGRLERADILVLVSETEGWPKSIAEGMAFGLICVGSDCGFVPEMLGEGRGLLARPGDAHGLAKLLLDVASDPASYDPMRVSAAAWAQRFSLEGLREAIRNLLLSHWSAEVPPGQPAIVEKMVGHE